MFSALKLFQMPGQLHKGLKCSDNTDRPKENIKQADYTLRHFW